jgi:catechol 2,3-dioxygenase-like lactoylglutathione lyase family enzyme
MAASSRGLSELVLVVADLEKSTAFYRDVIGLTVERKSSGWCWFWAGETGSAQRLALRKGSLLFEDLSPRPPASRWGPVHFALHVPRPLLEAVAERVRAHGAEVHGPTRFDWMRATSYHVYDPDGNLLEFWSPDPA